MKNFVPLYLLWEESVTFVRDEITGLINYIDKTFGKAEMEDSKLR